MQPPAPLLSIVVPALAPDDELRRCLDSVRIACGADRACEIVLVVPQAAVAEASRRFPDVKVRAERRRGIYGAMNDGIDASSGRYLYFLGKDDIVLPTLREVLAILEAEAPDLVSCDVYWGSRGVFRGTPARLLLLTRNLCHQGIVYRRELFAEHGRFVRAMRVQADHYFNIRVLWSTRGARVRYVRAPLAWYSGAGFSSRKVDPVFWRLYPLILRKHVGWWASLAVSLGRVARGKRSA
jgi:glycosyltransferase involved in cell wall biosynthesis